MNRIVREFFLGFIRLHILHHAEEGYIYGAWLQKELERHGYKIGPGTLYPLLHKLEEEKLLKSVRMVRDGRVRRCYTITEKGKDVLKEASKKVKELMGEVFRM